MKKDTPFLVMLSTLLLTSLGILAWTCPIPFPLQRWDDQMSLELKIQEMRYLEAAETAHPDFSNPIFSPVAEASR